MQNADRLPASAPEILPADVLAAEVDRSGAARAQLARGAVATQMTAENAAVAPLASAGRR